MSTPTFNAPAAAPTVTINQAAAQADPSGASPVVFDVVFNEDVTGFTNADVTLSGTAGANAVSVTQVDAAHYTVSVSGMTQSGTVIATIGAGAATAVADGQASSASTSTDNTVAYNEPAPPSVTINQAAAQADPSGASPVVFDVVFNENVTGFTNADVTLSGTAGANAVSVTQVDAAHYTVSVSGMTQSGTVIATIGAGAATAVADGQVSSASTSTDNTVVYNEPAPPSVTINQAAAQADPSGASPVVFDVVFNENVTGFTNADVTLSGSAGATTATVTQGADAAHYSVSVSGMTQSGTVIADIGAGAATAVTDGQASSAATFTDHTITYVVPSHPTGAFDFNFDSSGNGHSEILFQNDNGGVKLWDSGLPSNTSTISTSMPASWHLVGIGDFDGNGKGDILWQNDGGNVAIWDNGVTGHTIATGVPTSMHVVGTGDFDGNGKSDILWQNSTTGAVTIWSNGQSANASTIATSMPSSWHAVGVGDFDGNGKSDILWQNDGGNVAIWDNAAIGHTIATGVPTSMHVVGVGDFDGNGKSDILWQDTNTGAVTIWSNGQAANASTIATSMPASWHVAGLGDFDGNHHSDILWHNDSGAVAIWDNAVVGHTVSGPGALTPDWHIIV